MNLVVIRFTQVCGWQVSKIGLAMDEQTPKKKHNRLWNAMMPKISCAV
jgi:hypothetical protein